jgi:hypothetical protein
MDPSPPDAESEVRPVPEGYRTKNLTRDERHQIVSKLLEERRQKQRHQGVDGKFARGVLTSMALEFQVSDKTIRNVWARAVANFEDPNIRQFRSSPLQRNSGRPKKWNPEEIREAVQLVPLRQRRTIRDLAAALGIPKSTLHALKCGKENSPP